MASYDRRVAEILQRIACKTFSEGHFFMSQDNRARLKKEYTGDREKIKDRFYRHYLKVDEKMWKECQERTEYMDDYDLRYYLFLKNKGY